MYVNRTGGRVGLYIFSYKTRNDLTKIDASIEHQWVEIKKENKSSNEFEKRQWCEEFDYLMTQIYAEWNGIIFVTGGFNINIA